jgi:hypothetical protein
MFSGIVRWDLITMFVLFGVLITFELIGVFNTHMVTITSIIKTFVSIPLRIMIWSWLGWHFIVSDLVKMAGK